jgi:hypothetical protein
MRRTDSTPLCSSQPRLELGERDPQLMREYVLPKTLWNFLAQRKGDLRDQDRAVRKDFPVPVMVRLFEQLPTIPVAIPFEVAEPRQRRASPSAHRRRKRG